MGKIKIRLEASLQESQGESENQKRQHAEVEKAKPAETAQKEPNPAKRNSDATGTTLEELTGKKMERGRKVSYRGDEKVDRIPERRRGSYHDSKSGKKASDKRKGPHHEGESREKTAQMILKRQKGMRQC